MSSLRTSALVFLSLSSVLALPLPSRQLFEAPSPIEVSPSSNNATSSSLPSGVPASFAQFNGNGTGFFNGTSLIFGNQTVDLCSGSFDGNQTFAGFFNATQWGSNSTASFNSSTAWGNQTLEVFCSGNETFSEPTSGNSTSTDLTLPDDNGMVDYGSEDDGMEDCWSEEDDETPLATTSVVESPSSSAIVTASSAAVSETSPDPTSMVVDSPSSAASASATSAKASETSNASTSFVTSLAASPSNISSAQVDVAQTSATAKASASAEISFDASAAVPTVTSSSAVVVQFAASSTSSSVASTSTTTSSGGALSQAQIDEYLMKHNTVRSKYNAVDLKWDAEVAAVAQTYAEKCTWGHSQNPLYGENIASGTELKISDTVNMWAGEETEFDFANPVYDHFSQIVWKNTKFLGCGIADCHDPDTNAPFKYHVCNYKEPGNYEGEFKANVEGVTCASC